MIGRRIYDEACDWIVRLDSDAVSAGERSDFVRWLNRSPDHAEAYREMSVLWARMDTLSLARAERFAETAPGTAEAGRGSPWFLGYRGAVAASLAVIALIVVTVMFTDPVPRSGGAQALMTAEAGRGFTAPDGSRIRLGPHTTVTLAFTPGRRDVDLAHGELDVTVLPDARRPFVVTLGQYEVEALGTRFQVRRGDDGIDLKVLEGEVRFAARTGPARDRVPVASSGETTAIELGGGQSLSWRPGQTEVIVGTTDSGSREDGSP